MSTDDALSPPLPRPQTLPLPCLVARGTVVPCGAAGSGRPPLAPRASVPAGDLRGWRWWWWWHDGACCPPLCGGVGVSVGERTAASAADVVAWASRLLTATVHAGAGQRLGAAADRGRPPWVGGPTAAAGGGTKEGPLRKASRPLSSPATGRGGPRRPAPPSDAQPWRRSPRGRGDGGGRPAAALSPARGVAARGARCPRPFALAVQRPAVLGGPEPTARCGRQPRSCRGFHRSGPCVGGGVCHEGPPAGRTHNVDGGGKKRGVRGAAAARPPTIGSARSGGAATEYLRVERAPAALALGGCGVRRASGGGMATNSPTQPPASRPPRGDASPLRGGRKYVCTIGARAGSAVAP